MATTFAADQKLWPPIHSIFDFTLTFEDVVMGIVPSCLALLLLPLLIRHNLGKPRCIRTGFLLWSKMAIAIAIVGADIATLALRQSLPESRTQTSVAATVLATLASTAIAIAIYVVHLHNLQASAMTGVYLSLTMLLDATKSRSLFTRPGLTPAGAAAALTAALKLLLLALEEWPKTRLILHHPSSSPFIGPESTSGLWSRLLFLWLNPLFARGYRRKLTLNDIEGLGPEFAAELLHGKFSRAWRRNKSTAAFSLATVCFWCMPLAFLSIIVPELCATGFSFSQPFIMQRVIGRLNDQDTASSSSLPSLSLSSLSDLVGNSLIGATVLAFVGFTLTHNYASHMSYRLLAQLRGALITELYAKCNRLSMREAQKMSVVTLMTADIQALALGLAELYVIPLSLFQAGLGMYLLSLLVGYSFVLVLVPLLIATTAGFSYGRAASSSFATWNEAIDTRVAETANVLSQLPSIKMHGLGPVMVDYLENERAAEMEVSKRYRRIRAVSSLFLLFVDIATSPVVISGALFWTGLDGHHVNARQVFPALAVVSLIQSPLATSINSYMTVMTMLRSLQRIQDFLHSEENEDKRIVGGEGNTMSSVVGSGEKPQEGENQDTDDEKKKQGRDALAASAQGGSGGDAPVIRFVDATIAPGGHPTSVLRDVSFEAAKGSLTAVVGAIGSGKSTFLHSILGEADIQHGSVSIDEAGPIGYCDQHVWLRNASIRDNVVGPGTFDQARYDRVMRVCRLDEDLAQFSEGDGYIVGSNGSNLSGGQRQRLALARALYLEARLMVLDDIFSALDHPTALAIFSELFGENGMLKQSGCTVVLSTHLPECLDVANQILVFDGKGNVALENKLQNDATTRQKILDMLKEGPARVKKSSGDGEAGEQEDESIKEPQPQVVAPTAPPVPTFDGETARVISKFGLYGMLIRSMGSWLFVVYLVMQLIFSALEVLPDIYMRIWIEVNANNNLYFIGYAGLAIACCIIGSLSTLFYFTVNVPRSSIALHRSLSVTVMRSTIGFLSKTDNGSILNKYSQDMTMVARNLPAALSFSVYVFFGMCTQIGAILSTSKWIAIVLIVVLIAGVALQRYYLRTSSQMRHLELETHTPLYTEFLETSSGLRHIRAFGWEESFMKESFKLVDDSQKPFYTMYGLQRWLGLVLDSMSGALCIVLVTISVHLPGATTQAGLGLAFMKIISVGTSMNRLISTWTLMEVALGSLLRIHLFNIETPVEGHETFAKLDPDWPREGKIEFEGVTARYNSDEEEKVALRDVSFVIAPGQKVGLKGRTGSGKTSVLLTLLGFLEYTGTVRIDGVDISTIAPDELRTRIVTISQHSVKLGGTVRNNLLPFQINEKDTKKLHARDAELQAELVHLDLWETIHEKAGGLDAKLADVGLSAGQLQMFCIARAILRNRELGSGGVVLVDEGTSSIDYETDGRVQKALRESFDKCTVVTIAHRTDTIDDCDVQIELAKGEIVTRE